MDEHGTLIRPGSVETEPSDDDNRSKLPRADRPNPVFLTSQCERLEEYVQSRDTSVERKRRIPAPVVREEDCWRLKRDPLLVQMLAVGPAKLDLLVIEVIDRGR